MFALLVAAILIAQGNANVLRRTSLMASEAYLSCNVLEKDTDYVDNDIGNALAAQASECCNKCQDFKGCVAFAWSDYNKGTCWFKSAKGTVVKKPGVWASVVMQPPPSCKLEPGWDYIDNDIGNKPSTFPGGCCKICEDFPGCVAFSWNNHNGGTCWLKSAKGAVKADATVTSSLVKIVEPPKCTLEYGVDYYDHDIGNKLSATAGGCCQICKDFPGCKVFAWTKYNGGTCWLKSSKGNSMPNSNVISSVVVVEQPPVCVLQKDTDYYDNDIGNGLSANADGCCLKCKNFPGCKAFAWSNYNGGTCWFKNAKGPVSNVVGVWAAVLA